MELSQMVMESFAKIQSEGFVEQVVEKQIKNTVQGIVEETLREWSDFGKQLKAEVQSSINVNLKSLDIASYNTMVLNVVKEHLDQALHVQGVEKIKESLDELLGDAKKEYKLSEIIEEMKRKACEYDDERRGTEISLHIKDCSSLTFIRFDEDEDKESYECKYSLTIRNDDGTVQSAEIRDKKFDNRVIMGGLRGTEQTLFKLYTQNAKVIIDEDEIDRYYPSEDWD